MSQKLKITPGPWKLEAGRSIVTGNGTFHISYGKDFHGNPYFRNFVQLDNNAEFVAEAGTVANETGLMPRQLAEQRNELREALEELMAHIQMWQPDEPSYSDGAEACIPWTMARAAIAKARGDSDA